MISELLTAEQFAASRDELPDGGRWSELIAGSVVTLSPPDTEHGTTVLNLSKAVAACSRPDQTGYACFGLGLVVKRGPDTVRFPAMSFFADGPAFAESDKVLTDTCPALVVEIPSSNDRRRGLADRIADWLARGVRHVWVLDPQAQQTHVLGINQQPRRLSSAETLRGGDALPGFQSKVGELFQEPKWWRGPPKS